MAQKAIDVSTAALRAKYSAGMQILNTPFIDQFIRDRGGRLIREVSEAQYQAINVLVRQAALSETMSIPELAKAIRPTIGLTQRQSQAAFHVYEQAKENGYTEEQARKQQARYAEKLHRQRAETIAITETAYAYNWGQQAYMKQCMEDGLVGYCQAKWVTALDERVCAECGHMDGVVTEIDDPFEATYVDRKGNTRTVNGPVVPPMHPRCRCVVNYINVTQPKDWVRDEEEEEISREEEREELDTGETETQETETTGQQTQTDNQQTPQANPPVQTPQATAATDIAELDGEKFTITHEQHQFSDGKGMSRRKAENATVYTNADGVQFIFQDAAGKRQSMTPEQAAQIWHGVPEEIRKLSTGKIEFVGYKNPQDRFWKKKYKNFTRSYATGGSVITFYRHDTAHDIPYAKGAMIHEIGHQIDRKVGNGGNYSLLKDWQNAMAMDKIQSGIKSLTSYGENSAAEDFAESLKEAMLNPTRSKQLAPYRMTLLEQIIGRVIKRLGGLRNGSKQEGQRQNTVWGRLFRDILLRRQRERS